MRILVVSGFLGAGKTTFIQELARRTGRDFVVYENEYGQADIDAKVLSETDELSVWESAENCICCTGKQDFATSVLTIANTLDPEYLVVEPTGVARLSSILENIDQVSYERISLLAPLAIVDGVAWSRQRRRFEEIYLDQVRAANTVVISKAQLAGTGELAELVAWVRGANPGASVVDRPWDELDDAWFAGLLEGASGVGDGRAGGDAASVEVSGADDFESLSLAGIALPSESHLLWFLDALVAGVFGDVARAKGYLACGGQWLRFDVVDRMWQATGYEPAGSGGEPMAGAGESGSGDAVLAAARMGDAQTAARMDDAPISSGSSEDSVGVFIGRDICRPWLREVLLPLVRDAVAAGNVHAAEDCSHDVERGHACGHEHVGDHSYGAGRHDHHDCGASHHDHDHRDCARDHHHDRVAGHGHGDGRGHRDDAITPIPASP